MTPFRLALTDSIDRDAIKKTPAFVMLCTALQHLGYQIELVSTPTGRSLKMANDGLFDGELLRARDFSGEYQNLIFFDEAIAETDLKLLTQANHARTASTWNALTVNTVITVKGIFISELLPAQFASLPKVIAPNYKQAIKMLIAGRGELLIIPQLYIAPLQLNPTFDWDNNIQILKPSVLNVKAFLHFNKKHAQLIPALKSELQALRNTQQIEQVQQQGK